MWSHFTWVAQRKYTHNVIRKYWVWEIKNTCWVYSEHTEHIQYIVVSFEIYLVCSVCSKYPQHVFLISQTQYFLITVWVYFLWATQAKCGYIDSVYYECAKNMPTQHIVVTWPSIYWMWPQRSGSNTCWSLSLVNSKSTEHLLMGDIVVTWSSTFEYSHNLLSWEIVNTFFSLFWKNSACSDSGKCWYSGHRTTMYWACTGSVQGGLSPVTGTTPAGSPPVNVRQVPQPASRKVSRSPSPDTDHPHPKWRSPERNTGDKPPCTEPVHA